MSQRPIKIKSHRRIRNRGGVGAPAQPKKRDRSAPQRHGDERQRVSKLMAQRGLCSRREAERLIDMGQVEVDGKLITQQGVKVPINAQITLRSGGKQFIEDQATILFYKPRGILSMQYEDEVGTPAWECLRPENGDAPDSVRRLVAEQPRSFHVAGRLDKESQGLMVMTQNGRLVRRLTQGSAIDKEYHVTVHRSLETKDLQRLRQPIQFDNETILPIRTDQIAQKRLKIVYCVKAANIRYA